MLLEFLKKVEYLFKGLQLLLDALCLSISRYFQAESQWYDIEGIGVLLITEAFDVFEELVLGCDLMVMLKVIDHLPKVV